MTFSAGDTAFYRHHNGRIIEVVIREVPIKTLVLVSRPSYSEQTLRWPALIERIHRTRTDAENAIAIERLAR